MGVNATISRSDRSTSKTRFAEGEVHLKRSSVLAIVLKESAMLGSRGRERTANRAVLCQMVKAFADWIKNPSELENGAHFAAIELRNQLAVCSRP
jgi:hypothetical protein